MNYYLLRSTVLYSLLSHNNTIILNFFAFLLNSLVNYRGEFETRTLLIHKMQLIHQTCYGKHHVAIFTPPYMASCQSNYGYIKGLGRYHHYIFVISGNW